MEEEKITITLDISAVLNKCMFHINEITNCLTHIYQAINLSNIDVIKVLPTVDFPIQINTLMPKPTIEEQKGISINWIIAKGFEEFINGLTKSLKEAYRCLRIYELSKQSKIYLTKNDLDREIKKIDKKVEDLSFPTFIVEIEKLLNKKLFLRDEILSINKIRNCLEHRHGIVGEKDIKRSPSNELILKWYSIKTFTKIEDKQIELDYEYRKDGIFVENLQIKPFTNERKFKINDKITLDINDFNGISYTCLAFVQELFNIMPKDSTNN